MPMPYAFRSVWFGLRPRSQFHSFGLQEAKLPQNKLTRELVCVEGYEVLHIPPTRHLHQHRKVPELSYARSGLCHNACSKYGACAADASITAVLLGDIAGEIRVQRYACLARLPLLFHFLVPLATLLDVLMAILVLL